MPFIKLLVLAQRGFARPVNLLFLPFFLYITAYLFTLVVSLFYGAQPVLIPSLDPYKEQLRRGYIEDVLKTGRLLSFLAVVSIHEIEDCFVNPGEVFPGGYLDHRPGGSVFFEPGKVYVHQTHYIFLLGKPRTTVMACSRPL